jgi:hypothetical protein
VHHKTQKKNDFYDAQGNLFGYCEDYRFLGFQAVRSGKVHFSRACCLNNQGRKLYFPHQMKWCSLQDRSLAHEMEEGEVNMQDFLHHTILLHRNMSMPSCILV